jgi:hypothetical protein
MLFQMGHLVPLRLGAGGAHVGRDGGGRDGGVRAEAAQGAGDAGRRRGGAGLYSC